MPIISSGVLLYRYVNRRVEVLLVHPGGLFWSKKDLGAWSIPKGTVDTGEDLLAAAKREFQEETGGTADGAAIALGSIRQRSGKVVHGWAVQGEFDPAELHSNELTLEWPRGSGRMHTYPEVDRAAWFGFDEARRRIVLAQRELLDRLATKLKHP